jgi:hypothetical protein
VRPPAGAVIFLVDGLAPRIVMQGVQEGWLPNIRQRFVDGGTRVEFASAAVPAITYGAIASLLTGAAPAHHEIVGNRWFDPEQNSFRDYCTIKYYRAINRDFDEPTLYELLQPAPTASIQAAHQRGVSLDIANWATSGVMWFFHDYTAVDKLTATSVDQVRAWANARRTWPTVLMCYFPGVDSVAHEHGASSLENYRSIRNVDHQIGRVCDWLDAQGLLQTTTLALVSDHGMLDVDPANRMDLKGLVAHWGRRATDHILQDQDEPAAGRQRHFARYDTVICYQNGRAAFLYFRGPAGWAERPAPEQVAAVLTAPAPHDQLWNLPGVGLVTYLTNDDRAVLRNQFGECALRRREVAGHAEYAYDPTPDDLLGYLHDPRLADFVRAGFHDDRAWLAATAGQRLPDVVPTLIPLLHVPRAGQVVIFAAPGYSFIDERGGHGGLDRDEQAMTFMLAGPGIPAGGVIPVARGMDLTPTLLDLLDRTPEDVWLDGISLAPALRTAGQGTAP